MRYHYELTVDEEIEKISKKQKSEGIIFSEEEKDYLRSKIRIQRNQQAKGRDYTEGYTKFGKVYNKIITTILIITFLSLLAAMMGIRI